MSVDAEKEFVQPKEAAKLIDATYNQIIFAIHWGILPKGKSGGSGGWIKKSDLIKHAEEITRIRIPRESQTIWKIFSEAATFFGASQKMIESWFCEMVNIRKDITKQEDKSAE